MKKADCIGCRGTCFARSSAEEVRGEFCPFLYYWYIFNIASLLIRRNAADPRFRASFIPSLPLSQARILLFAVVYLTLTDPLRIQPWSHERWNQTKSNQEHVRRKKIKEISKQTEKNAHESSQQNFKRHRRQEGTQKRQ